ncbi:MAG: helix-turn-helix transcriptional regulator [Limimaricola soesokkakensis]|uniref:helix-turn-helix transcriptional regulator n=1 Tax=Limimaricola soesokkakensis TaxID=1343159 RepID=UPI00405919B3
MIGQLSTDALADLAPAGFFLGLHVRFIFPTIRVSTLPKSWIERHTCKPFFLDAPASRWSLENEGAIRWSALADHDPLKSSSLTAEHDTPYGGVVAYHAADELRSYGLFFRGDREYLDTELAHLFELVVEHHDRLATPPAVLTKAELLVLRCMKEGKRLKQISYDLDVSQSAVKQRLRNARRKLGARSGSQAVAMAAKLGLL